MAGGQGEAMSHCRFLQGNITDLQIWGEGAPALIYTDPPQAEGLNAQSEHTRSQKGKWLSDNKEGEEKVGLSEE